MLTIWYNVSSTIFAPCIKEFCLYFPLFVSMEKGTDVASVKVKISHYLSLIE